MVVNISTEFPGQNIQAKIIKILETIIYRVDLFLGGPLRLNSRRAKIAQFYLSPERDNTRMTSGNLLTPNVGDPNTRIPESKAFMVDVVKEA